MRLGAKSVVVVVLAMVGLVTALHAFATRFIVQSFAALEAQRARELAEHARATLAFQAQEFGESGDDWAQWNDVIIYAAERNETWESENLNALSYEMKSWTDMLIVRDDRSIAWAKALRSDGTLGPAHSELLTLAAGGKLSYPTAEERPIDGLVRLDSELYLVTSRPLKNVAGVTRQHGVLVATQRIDDGWLQRFERLTSLDLELVPADATSLDSAAVRAVESADGMALGEPSDSEITIYQRIEDASGQSPFVAVIHAPRPLVGAARAVLAVVTVVLVVLGVLAAGLTLLILHFGVVRRLRRLARASEGLSRGDLIDLEGVGADEIGALAQDFAAMGRAVLEREQSIRAATAKKKLVLDHAGSALLTCDSSGLLVGEASSAALEWFGTPAPACRVWDFVGHDDDPLREQLRVDFRGAREKSSHAPLRRTVGDRLFDCRWSVVRAGLAGSVVLLVMRDVTEIVLCRRREEEEREAQRRWSARSRQVYSERGDRRVHVKEHRALLDQLRAAGVGESALRSVRAWAKAPLRPILQGLADMAGRVGEKLDKVLHVELRVESLRVDRERTGQLWASLVHLLRNAVDHGIEATDEREQRGKPRSGALGIAASLERGALVVIVSDDGRGVDWPRVAAKAAERGLPNQTHEELVLALFADGLSTRDEASEISGRGVGLAAVRAAVLALGGSIVVSSVVGEGTQFRIVLPGCADAAAPLAGEASESPVLATF